MAEMLTHVAASPRLVDVWLDWVEQHHTLQRFEVNETSAGLEVTAYVAAGGELEDQAAGVVDPAPPARALAGGRCECCGTQLPVRTGRGRRRRYCSDACRSRAARERNPKPPTCQLRVGGWPCERPAVAYLREPDPARPGKVKLWGFTAAVCGQCLPLAEAFAAANGHTTFRQSIQDHQAELRARLTGEPDMTSAAETPDPEVALLEPYVQAVSQQLTAALMADVPELHAWRADDGRLTACLTLDLDNEIDGPWLLVWDEETGWRASAMDPLTDREIYTEHLHRGGVLPSPDHIATWLEDVALPGRTLHRKPKLFRRAGDDDQFVDQLRAVATGSPASSDT